MNRRGLTLLEVLIAVALGIVLLGSVTTFAWSQLTSRQHILEAASARRSLTLVIDRLEQDLISAVAGTSDGQAGVGGDSSSITVYSRGVAPQWTDDPASMINDLHRLAVSFDVGAGHLEMTRSPHLDSIDGEGPIPLPGVLMDFRIRYFDGDVWLERWDSIDEGRLPMAVEIAAWYGRPEQQEDDEDFDAAFERSEFDRPAELEDLFDDETPFESVPDRRRVIPIPDADVTGDELDMDEELMP